MVSSLVYASSDLQNKTGLRVEVAEEALDLIRFHLIELTKPLEGLTLEQQVRLTYLTTEFTFPDGDDGDDYMNQREPKRQQHLIPAGVSEESARLQTHHVLIA